MKISVVVCTYNRAALLSQAITSLENISYPIESFEIIIVDNNSTDSTKSIVQKHKGESSCNIRYIFENCQGLSFARNKGIMSAKGEIVVFVDDDIEPAPDWLNEIISGFDSPEIVAVGGPIRPLWPREKPDWLLDSMLEPLTISEFPKAALLGEFIYPDIPFGANMAFRREIFEKIGLFATELGRKGNSLLSNEDVELFHRIQRLGLKVRFSPNAVIYHKIDPNRLTRRWFYRRYYWQGRSDAVLDNIFDVNVYPKLRGMIPLMQQFQMNSRELSFNDRCAFFSLKGYLHQLFFADSLSEDKIHLRSMRSLAIFVATISNMTLPENISEKLAQRDRQIYDLTSSLSWRITAPLRYVHSIGKRFISQMFSGGR